MYKEEKELWVKFACAALANCAATVEKRTNDWNRGTAVEDWLDEEDFIEDDCSYAAQYADKMVALFYDKFKDC